MFAKRKKCFKVFRLLGPGILRAGIQFYELTWRSLSLDAVSWACMQFHELVCSSYHCLSSSQEFRSACLICIVPADLRPHHKHPLWLTGLTADLITSLLPGSPWSPGPGSDIQREAHSLRHGPEVTQTTWGTRRLVRWVTLVLTAFIATEKNRYQCAAARDLHFAFSLIIVDILNVKRRDLKLKNFFGIFIVMSKRINQTYRLRLDKT